MDNYYIICCYSNPQIKFAEVKIRQMRRTYSPAYYSVTTDAAYK